MSIQRDAVNTQSRIVVMPVEFDPKDEAVQDAFCIADCLRGAGLLRASTTEAVRQILPRLRKRSQVVNTLSDEVLSLEKAKLATRMAEIKERKERRMQDLKAHESKMAAKLSRYRRFYDVALQMMDVADFMVIRDEAEKEQ
jgi:hypothetical protein